MLSSSSPAGLCEPERGVDLPPPPTSWCIACGVNGVRGVHGVSGSGVFGVGEMITETGAGAALSSHQGGCRSRRTARETHTMQKHPPPSSVVVTLLKKNKQHQHQHKLDSYEKNNTEQMA